MRAATAEGLAGSGTAGTRLGTAMPTTPSPMTPTRATTWRTRSERMPCGRRKPGSAESARTAPPTGNVAAPVRAITPLAPITTPGVASPWMARSAAMTVKAAPTSTTRPSCRRTPTTVSARAATEAITALTPTPMKCTFVPRSCEWCPKKVSAAPGTIAPAPRSARSWTTRSRGIGRMGARSAVTIAT
jgi:hypothetical protein